MTVINLPGTVTLTVNKAQLRDIRIAVLHRLDTLALHLRLLPANHETRPEIEQKYDHVRALMAPGGPLYKAMIEIHGGRVNDIT